MSSGPYPEVNNMVPSTIGLRSSLKGAAYVLPIQDQFLTTMMTKFDDFHSQCDDAGASIIAWELFDPTIVSASEKGCFANRGFHLNSLIMPMWTQAANDAQCRQWAREMSLMFKHELETQGQRTSKGVEGGASVKGKKGAALLYGNYDVSLCTMGAIHTLANADSSNTTRSHTIFSATITLACRS